MKIIVSISRLIAMKGIQDLIEATRNLDVVVNIVGDGVYRGELEKIAHKNVHFLGTLSKHDVKRELRSSDIFVMLSYNEGLPTTILEAGCMGVQVISSDVGAVREVIDDGVDGWIYPAGDVNLLRERIRDALLFDLTGLREKIIKGFSWKVNAKKFLEVLESV